MPAKSCSISRSISSAGRVIEHAPYHFHSAFSAGPATGVFVSRTARTVATTMASAAPAQVQVSSGS
ncbi:MAG TPA: hypothetical protein VGK73_11685, partial [Polyangiaceae bacterium]